MRIFSKTRSKNKNRSIALVFDIGSGSVGGGLVVLSENDLPKLLYSARRDIVFQENLNFDRFVSSMFESFTVVVQNIQRKGLQYINTKELHPDNIGYSLFMYASPWYSAQTKILTLKKEKPFVVTRGLVDKIIQKEKKSSLKDTVVDDNKPTSRGDVIERSVTAIKLNGYTVSDVDNKVAKDLELTVSTTTLSHSVASGLEDILRHHFYEGPVVHHSFPMTIFAAIRDIFDSVNDFLVMDVSGEVTDISLVKNGALLETASFPIGKNYVIRRLIKELGISSSEAQSLLRMYSEKSTTSASSIKTQEVMMDIKSKWSDGFNKALKEIEEELIIPHNLFFIADKEFIPLLKVFIEGADKHNRFQSESVEYMTIRKYVDFSSEQRQDPFLGLGTFFLNKIL